MKLYATTTSERASKGQGGNDYLEIKVGVGDKDFPMIVCRVNVKRIALNGKDEYLLSVLDGNSHVVFKGNYHYIHMEATKYCNSCGARTFGEGFAQGTCDRCYDMKEEQVNVEAKGEKKKGEYITCEVCKKDVLIKRDSNDKIIFENCPHCNN